MAKLIGTAGHVDHGKTSLIAALTGIDADRLPDEKRRGMTIEIGFAYLELPKAGRVSIVDVPGHERFIANMLVGALGIDVALLCVSADAGVMPQTREHVQILELLPVEQLVVALTRADLADEESRELAQIDVVELLADTRFAGSPMVAVSAVSGEGLTELADLLDEALSRATPRPEGMWYLPVDRAFVVKGHGVVVTGTLAGGSLAEGAAAELQPGTIASRVRSIRVHDTQLSAAEPGQRTAVNLAGVRLEDVRRGMVLAAPGMAQSTGCLDATVRWLEKPKHGARIRLSIGSEEVIGRVFHSDSSPDLCQLRLENLVGAVLGQPLIVRQYSPPSLLGGGAVRVPLAHRRRKNEDVPAAVLVSELTTRVEMHVRNSREGLDTEEVGRLAGATVQGLAEVFAHLKDSGRLLSFAGRWTTPDQYNSLTDRITHALHDLHQREPTKSLQPKEAVAKTAGLGWTGKPLDRLLSRLTEEGKLKAGSGGVALSEFKPALPARQRQMLDRVLAELARAPLSPPSIPEIAQSLGVPRQAVEEIIKVGMDAGEVTRVADGFFLVTSELPNLRARALAHFGDRGFGAGEFRELFQTSRKFAIPLLEWFDARGWTVRHGDQRRLVRLQEATP